VGAHHDLGFFPPPTPPNASPPPNTPGKTPLFPNKLGGVFGACFLVNCCPHPLFFKKRETPPPQPQNPPTNQKGGPLDSWVEFCGGCYFSFAFFSLFPFFFGGLGGGVLFFWGGVCVGGKKPVGPFFFTWLGNPQGPPTKKNTQLGGLPPRFFFHQQKGSRCVLFVSNQNPRGFFFPPKVFPPLVPPFFFFFFSFSPKGFFSNRVPPG